ncbi:MAG: nicotinate-nucleotide adenylyltransferase [Gammaproteobacteria bacterium]|jgi:nicotinate-nucleotide adenylyltransferase
MKGHGLEQPIGILGGTFDPVHCGHLRLAIEALERLDLAQVRLIPLNNPNHRAAPIVGAERRLTMLQSSVDRDQLVVDPRELERDGVSYTIDTLTSLRTDFENRPLCLLLGADAFNGLCGWHRWEELLDYCHLVVVNRPGSDNNLEPRLQQLLERVQTADPDILSSVLNGRILFLSIPLLPISSTDVRARVAEGRSISYLVPPSVQQNILQNEFYKSPK